LRILACTFGQGDLDKMIQAMRSLAYDRLALIGMPGIEECEDLRKIRQLEDMAGNEVEVVVADAEGFLEIVGQVSQALASRMGGRRAHGKDSVVLNISGGSKLLGDAALLAAFELGLEAYHINGRVTRLPIVRGATARDRFSKGQIQMVEAIGDRPVTLEALASTMEPTSRQGVDRVIRELRNEGLIGSGAEAGKVRIWLTPTGLQVLRALKLTGAG